MKKFTPYINGLLFVGTISLVLTILGLYLSIGTALPILTFVMAYICLFAAGMAPDHEKYKDVPRNPSHHDRSKRQS